MNIRILKVWLALMASVSSVLAAEEAVQDEPIQACGVNSQASELGRLIKLHPAQKRPLLVCNGELAKIAQIRAEQLGTNSKDKAITPNQFLNKGGFRVASYYPVTGNQVEAVAKDMVLPEQVIKYLSDSGKYSEHVLGKGEFFGLQSQLGVGFFKANDITTHDQWVVLMAEPWQSQKIVFKQAKPIMPFKLPKGCDTDWKNGNDDFLKSKCRGMAKRTRQGRNN